LSNAGGTKFGLQIALGSVPEMKLVKQIENTIQWNKRRKGLLPIKSG